MEQSARDYLIRAHSKVIAHHHTILDAESLTQSERERIKRNLAEVDAELDAVGERLRENKYFAPGTQRHRVKLGATFQPCLI